MNDGLEQFCAFAERIRLLDKLIRGGNLPSVIPRIIGKGKTRADGFFDDRPPALIERLYEYSKLDLTALSNAINYPIPETDPLREEQRQVKQRIDDLQRQLNQPNDGWQRSAREVLSKLGEKSPGRDGRYSMGKLELNFDKKTLSWAWKLAGAYSLVSKIPHDVGYICDGYQDACRRVAESIVPSETFLSTMKLTWAISQCRAGQDAVLIRDFAKVYVVAAQDKNFWDKPSKAAFSDISDAAFVLNLVESINDVRKVFELVKAGVHQTGLGGQGRNVSYDLPKRGGDGTEPYVTIKMREPLQGSSHGN